MTAEFAGDDCRARRSLEVIAELAGGNGRARRTVKTQQITLPLEEDDAQ